MKVLITGFQPFGGEKVNPAYLAVSELPEHIQAGDASIEVIKMEVPVLYNEGARAIIEKIETVKPDVVIAVGQAGGRTSISLERVAVNVQDATVPDNGGVLKTDQPIEAAGPAAYFSTLPIRTMEQKMREAGVPVGISNSAGLYVCNDVMYQLLHYTAEKAPQMKAGFIHVPYVSTQVIERPSLPSLPLDTIVAGLTAAIQALA